MAEYATWKRDDGLSIDPWIRTHQRMGATILKPAPDSIVVTGTVAEWESWTGMPFPISGSYFVPGALNLVEVDRDRDTGSYHEERKTSGFSTASQTLPRLLLWACLPRWAG